MTRPTEKYTIKRGELFNDLVEVRQYNADGTLDATFDFSGFTMEVDLRDPDTGKEVQQLTVSTVENVPGKLVLQFQATAAQTNTFPEGKTLVGDLKIFRTSPAYGPYFPASIEVTVLQANTR